MTYLKAFEKLIIALSILVISGCGEYIPRETYLLKTVDGRIIKLSCPTIDRARSILTYMHEGDCVLIQ